MKLSANSGASMAMTQKVLLTGRPGCGKTTLIRRVVTKLAGRIGGFYTEEMREADVRVGFKLVTLDGKEAVFARVDFKTPVRVGKYGLHLFALENIGVQAIRNALSLRRLIVIDEIGPMEIRSRIFRDTVIEAFDSRVAVLGTISARPLPFIDIIKSRPGVQLVEIRPSNRDRLVSELSDQFKNETDTDA